MENVKLEILQNTAKLYDRLYTRSVILKIVLFTALFSAAFWFIRSNNILPDYKLEADRLAIPALFGAGNLIFSVIGAFVIQTQWTKWDRLIDANRGEITMLRQLFILVHHFPREEMNQIRFRIYQYLTTYIQASQTTDLKRLSQRSTDVEEALIRIDDSVFNAARKHPEVGQLVVGYLTSAMEYREKKIQLTNQRLPRGIKLFVYASAYTVIIGSFFVPFNYLGYNYYFTLVVALLAFGVIMIIEDFDHPFRPGSFVLSVRLYQVLLDEVEAKLKQRGFDIEAAYAKDEKKIV